MVSEPSPVKAFLSRQARKERHLLRQKTKPADGLLLVTTEYNNGIPGVY